MEFLQRVGLSSALIVAFGLVQKLDGVLLVPRRTRMFGAVLAALTFVASTVLIFVGGNLAFGLVSMLPIALACVIIYQSAAITHNKSFNSDASDAGARIIQAVMHLESYHVR
jgi:predicted MFS family arabinose efflux permease